MTGKRFFYFILSGLFLISNFIPVFGSGLSSSASIAVTARVEQPVGFQNVVSPRMDQNLLRAPASSELQIEIEQNNSIKTFNYIASKFITDDWNDLLPDSFITHQVENPQKTSDPIVFTVIIISQ
jgi:hypothetical protein